MQLHEDNLEEHILKEMVQAGIIDESFHEDYIHDDIYEHLRNYELDFDYNVKDESFDYEYGSIRSTHQAFNTEVSGSENRSFTYKAFRKFENINELDFHLNVVKCFDNAFEMDFEFSCRGTLIEHKVEERTEYFHNEPVTVYVNHLTYEFRPL